MGYIPKSKYEQLFSSGDKYVDPRTNQPYVGPYILTSEGAFIAKTSIRNSIKLRPKNPRVVRNNLFITEELANYQPLNKKTSDFVKSTFPIISTKVKPTEKDYERGYYTRYFCKRNNAENVYFEIDKTTHNKLRSNNRSYDYNLYTADSLIWSIEGDIIKANTTTLNIASRKYPNISSLFVKLDEFQNVKIAKKGELTYLDGTEYLGPYHVHPLNGPMVGAFHRSEPHEKLLFVDKNTLYIKDPNAEPFYHVHGDYDFDYTNTTGAGQSETSTTSTTAPSTYSAPSQVQQQVTQVVSQPSSAPSTGGGYSSGGSGGSSGGGGGGY